MSSVLTSFLNPDLWISGVVFFPFSFSSFDSGFFAGNFADFGWKCLERGCRLLGRSPPIRADFAGLLRTKDVQLRPHFFIIEQKLIPCMPCSLYILLAV